MEGRVDDSGWGWKMPGSAHWWSLHNTRTDERDAEQLQSILMFRGRGRGGRVWGLPRVPEWRYTSTPCVRHIQTKTNTALSKQHLGLGITSLFVAMATLDSLSFPFLSHEQMWANTYLWGAFSHWSWEPAPTCWRLPSLRAACEQ